MKSKRSLRIIAQVSGIAAMAALLLMLNGGDMADAPFSGDNGLKMWQAASISTSGDHLVRPVPEGMEPSDHAPGLTASTPGGGISGVYGTAFPHVMQLLSMGSTLVMRMVILLLTIASIPILSRLCGGSIRGSAAFIIAGLVPYSLIFWEHGPAVTLFLLGTLLLLEQLEGRKGRLPWWMIPFAISCVWRPENAVCLVGLLAAAAVSGRGLPGYIRTMTAAGLSLVILAGAALAAGSSFFSLHLRSNLPSFGGDYFLSRLEVLGSWSVPLANLPALAGLAISVIAGGALLLRRRLRISGTTLGIVRTCGLAGSLVVGYYFIRGSIGHMSLLSLSPGLLLLPFLSERPMDLWSRIMVTGGLAGGLLVFLASPTDGMFQFGARFLLVPAALTAAGLLRTVRSPAGATFRRALLPLAIAVVTLLATLRAVVFQESFRRWHHGLSQTIGDLPDGTVVATDQPWLPLVIWRVTMTRPVLCIRERDEVISLAGSEIELIWISREGLPGGAIGQSGYRDLRISAFEGPETLPALPGPTAPTPPPLSI